LRAQKPLASNRRPRFPAASSFKDANGQAVTVAWCGIVAIRPKKASDRATGPIEAVAFDWRDFAPQPVNPREGLMKKLFTSISALTIMAAFSANAADMGLPIKAQPQPAYSWTGCYLGVQAGGGAITHDNFSGGSGGGFLAGGQVGCNYQFDQVVVGIEGEGWWSGIKSHFYVVGGQQNETTKNRWDADVAFRAGFAWDRAFIYGKGGMAWGHFGLFGTVFGFTDSGSGTLPGLLIGIGGEYALSTNWSAKLEYEFIDYFLKTVTISANGVPNDPVTFDATKQIIKVGMNYKFTP
jgi:outer membrane immunogenic protein